MRFSDYYAHKVYISMQLRRFLASVLFEGFVSSIEFSYLININMNHLVSGGTGFIGSHLIDQLMNNESNNVICLDYYDDYDTILVKNIHKWLDNPRFKLIKQSPLSSLTFERGKIWHLSCNDFSSRALINPIYTTRSIIFSTLSLLELAKATKSEFLFASSSDVYGNPLPSVQDEQYHGNVNSIGVRSCMHEGNRVAESLCFDYQRMFSLRIHIARIFDAYGPRMDPRNHHVVSEFIHQISKHKAVTIYGNGRQTRSFCYISDIITGLEYLMNSIHSGPFNLGNPDKVSISLLARMISSILNCDLHIEYKIPRADEAFSLCPSIDLAKNLLHWEPIIPLENGLMETIVDIQMKQRNYIR